MAGVGVGAGVGIVDGLGVGLGVESAGIEVGAGVGFGVESAGIAVGAGVEFAVEFLTMTEIDALPIGEVPPCWKTRTIRVWLPFATAVEFHGQLPLPDHTLVPSTKSWSQ